MILVNGLFCFEKVNFKSKIR